MKTEELLSILNKNRNKELLFEYSKGQHAGTNYHLTEVKNVSFESVDCGGVSNNWKETHLQLWESPSEIGKADYMTVDKVIDILERVNAIKSLSLETEVKIEFGNADFHTSVMPVASTLSESNRLTIKLFTAATGCKASELCGVTEAEKASVEEEACCSGSSCC